MKIAILLTIIFLCVSCEKKYSGRIAPKAVNGVLDLSSWDFEKDGQINIEGEWNFYWKKIVNPQLVKKNGIPISDGYVKVPGDWNNPINFKQSDKPNNFGYATYILEIKGLKEGTRLGITSPIVSSSFNLFQLSKNSFNTILKSGIVGKTENTEVPQHLDLKNSFVVDSKDLIFVLQISNFHFYKQSVYSGLKLGLMNPVFWNHSFKNYRDLFVLGILLIMSLYHFGLFSQRSEDKASLFFALLCLLLFLRTFFVGEYFFWFLPKPSVWSFEARFKFSFLSFLYVAPIFLNYLSYFFDLKRLKLLSFISLIPSLIYTPFVIFLNTKLFYNFYSLRFFQLIMLIIGIYVLSELIYLSWKRKRNSLPILIGTLILVIGGFHDIAITFNLVKPPEITALTLCFFILIQSYIISTEFSSAYRESKYLRDNLAKEVKEQSKKIENQYKDYRALLFNLDQGFLIFDKYGIVVTESTEITKDLFLLDPINKKVEDILQLRVGEKQNFRKWISHVYRGVVPFKDLTALAPSSFEKIQGRFIKLEFKPIFFEKSSKEIDKIMCIATDITEKIKFEREAEIEKKKAQRLTNILERPLEFLDLIGDAEETIKHYTQRLKNSKPNAIFRSFHTLKARFGSFQLSETVQNIHNLENYLNDIEDRWIDEDIKEVWNLIEKIRFDHSEFIRKNRRLLEIANNSINSSEDSVNPNALMKKIENDYKAYHKQFVLRDVSSLLKKFILPTKELAKQQDKPINIKVDETDIYVDPKKYKDCFSSFLHIFRNSIDHGIESREERIAKNKSEISNINISIELSTKKDCFKIKIKDDGKGIDPNVIKKIASTKEKLNYLHLDKLSDQDIIELIFEPGFSSKEEASEVSGRGVGMDAVKTEISKVGGTIRVMSKVDIGTTFEITLPLFA